MENEEIVQTVRTAVSEVFSTMMGIEVEPCESVINATGPHTTDGIMSFVGMTGTWVGSGLISCHSTFACQLCSAFLMTESTHVDAEVLDAIGEIANMIIGNFKTAAEAVVGPLALSIPTTIYGKSFGSKSPGNKQWLVVPFKSGDNVFEVGIWFAPAMESQTHRHGTIQLQAT